MSARMPQMDDDISIPRNTTVVSVACWYSVEFVRGNRDFGLGVILAELN